VAGPGLRRVRRGKGFSYHGPDGSSPVEVDTVTRIRQLAIPPAWRQVWICPSPNGHIQAVDPDAAQAILEKATASLIRRAARNR
jgi:DNA topoisomerase-1